MLYLSATTNLLALSPEKENENVSTFLFEPFEFNKYLAIVLAIPGCLTSLSVAALASFNALVLISSNKGISASPILGCICASKSTIANG